MIEMFVRMLHHCGMPKEDVDLIHGNGKVVGEILNKAGVRSTLFTGSSKVAETLAVQLKGKVTLFLSYLIFSFLFLSSPCLSSSPLLHYFSLLVFLSFPSFLTRKDM